MGNLIPCNYCKGPGDCFVCGGSGWVEPPIQMEPKEEQEYHAEWYCKYCKKHTDHKYEKVESRSEGHLLLSGTCGECGNTNMNYFPIIKSNPIFGIGP